MRNELLGIGYNNSAVFYRRHYGRLSKLKPLEFRIYSKTATNRWLSIIMPNSRSELFTSACVTQSETFEKLIKYKRKQWKFSVRLFPLTMCMCECTLNRFHHLFIAFHFGQNSKWYSTVFIINNWKQCSRIVFIVAIVSSGRGGGGGAVALITWFDSRQFNTHNEHICTWVISTHQMENYRKA